MRILSFPEFDIHQIRGYIEEIFLVVYPDKILLLDGVGRPDVKTVASYITDTLKRPIEHLRLVVVTHMHPDHAGGAPHLRKKYGVKILASPFADQWYVGTSGAVQKFLDVMMGQFVAKQNGNLKKRLWYKRTVNPDFIARNETEVPYFKDWKIINTPGHTDHDISIYNEKYGLIYLADVLLRIKDKFLLPFPIAIPDVMKHSLQELSQLHLRYVLMAHGGMAKEEDFSGILQRLSHRVFDEPNRKFRMLKHLVSVTKSIERAKQRFEAMAETGFQD